MVSPGWVYSAEHCVPEPGSLTLLFMGWNGLTLAQVELASILHGVDSNTRRIFVHVVTLK